MGGKALWKTDKRAIPCLKLSSEGNDTVAEIHVYDGSQTAEDFHGYSPFMRLIGPFAKQLRLKLTEGEYEVTPPLLEMGVKGVDGAEDRMVTFQVAANVIANGSQTPIDMAVKLQEKKCGLPSLL